MDLFRYSVGVRLCRKEIQLGSSVSLVFVQVVINNIKNLDDEECCMVHLKSVSWQESSS